MKRNYQKFKMLVPVAVLTVISLWTALTSFSNEFILTIEHYCGFVALAICITSFFILRRYYKYVLPVTLLLGLFNFINFTPFTSTTSFHINSLSITFQLVSFLICVLTVILRIPKKDEIIVANKEQVSADNQKKFIEDREHFKNIFSNKLSEDLIQTISDERYTAAAKEAAQQILNDRQSTT